MCISHIRDLEPEEMEGIGYKIVRISDKEDEFYPEYNVFCTDGSGGITFLKKGEKVYNVEKGDYVKTNIVYKLGKKNVVRHNRMATTDDSFRNRYRAGIHLYRDINSLYGNLQSYFSSVRHDLRVIKCKYKKAITCNSEVIVALEVTPIEVIK